MAEKLEALFPDGDDTGSFIVLALDVRSHFLSIKDCGNGVGKPVFKLAPLGNGQVFALTAPDLHVPGIPDVATGHLSSQHGHCVLAAPSPPHFSAAWRVEAPFSAVSLSDGLYSLRSL